VPALLDFLNGGELPVGLNDTSITLIPKVRNPQVISQYRPIALCPVLYKIAAKAITNRLRSCLNEIISEEQSKWGVASFFTPAYSTPTTSPTTANDLFFLMDLAGAFLFL
jgi:hypothetical protein